MRAISKSDKNHIHLDMYLGQIGYRILYLPLWIVPNRLACHKRTSFLPLLPSIVLFSFTDEAKKARDPYTYLPWGHGPRNCIGMRLALLEMKIALVKLLQRFRVVTCEKTQVGCCVWMTRAFVELTKWCFCVFSYLAEFGSVCSHKNLKGNTIL